MKRSVVFFICIAALVVSGCSSTRSGGDLFKTNPERAARINTELGIAYMRQGDHERAMEKLTRATEQDSSYADAWVALAVLYDNLNEERKADRHYRRAVDLAPDDSSILNNYGRFLCEQGDRRRAQDYFEKAVSNPLYRSPEVPLTNAALCAFNEQDYETAENYFMKALEANPKFPVALLHMAEIRQQEGDYMSARGFLQRYQGVAQPTAQSLRLGIEIETALGNEDAVASYSLLLKSRFEDKK